MAQTDALTNGTIAIVEKAQDDLELLVQVHGRLAYRIAFSVLRNPHDAEDAVQDVFLRVLRSRKPLAQVTDLAAYVARIAWNVSNDLYRRKRPAPDFAMPEHVPASQEQSACDREIMSFVESAVAELPAPLRDALRLSAVDELPTPAAAKMLGVAEGTVRTRVHRAREILRRKLTRILDGRDV